MSTNMKFSLASDLHLFFGSLVLDNSNNSKVLILAGDIAETDLLTPSENHYVTTFFKNISKQFEHVLWVAGNHEHYGTRYPEAHEHIKNWLKFWKLDNIRFLENETVKIDDVYFHGCTLWTNLNNINPLDVMRAFNGLNDYIQIKDWDTNKQIRIFNQSLEFLDSSIVKGSKNIVITHHHPSSESIVNHYRSSLINSSYYSNLGEFILDHPDINFWCCGHIHTKLCYNINNTTVLCNPRGYNKHEQVSYNFSLDNYEV